MTDEHYTLLAAAVGLPFARVSVRAPGAIAEVLGPLPLRPPQPGGEWLTVGDDRGSHVHVKASEVQRLRFSAPPDANLALELLDREGARLCRVSFGHTNRAKSATLDEPRLAEVLQRFGHLAEND